MDLTRRQRNDLWEALAAEGLDDGTEVHHFALLAEPATVVRRLRARSLGLEPGT